MRKRQIGSFLMAAVLVACVDERDAELDDEKQDDPSGECTDTAEFHEIYGYAWGSRSVAFVTAGGTTVRGIDALDIDAAKHTGKLLVKGATSEATRTVSKVQLLKTGNGFAVLREFTSGNRFVFDSLKEAALREANGSAGTVERAVHRVFIMDKRGQPQGAQFSLEKMHLRLLLDAAETLVSRDAAAELDGVRKANEAFFGRLHELRSQPYFGDRAINGTAGLSFGSDYEYELSFYPALDTTLRFRKRAVEGEWRTVSYRQPPTCRGLTTATFDDSVYVANSTPETWDVARTRCEALGGHLATVTDELENYAVFHLLGPRREALMAQPATFFAGQQFSTWIGLNDREEEGNFSWLDGTEVDYFPLSDVIPPVPSAETRDCMGITWAPGTNPRGPIWMPHTCAETKASFVCELRGS